MGYAGADIFAAVGKQEGRMNDKMQSGDFLCGEEAESRLIHGAEMVLLIQKEADRISAPLLIQS